MTKAINHFSDLFSLDGLEKTVAGDAPDYFDTFLAKANGVPDFAAPGKPLAKSASLPESSERRLQKATVALDRLFPRANPDLREEAVGIFRTALLDARAKVLEPLEPLYVTEAVAQILGVSDMGG